MGWLIGGAVTLVTLTAFGIPAALWVAFLTFAAHRAPRFALAGFLLGLSFDRVEPVFSLQIAVSELALLALVSVTLLGNGKGPATLVAAWRDLDWKPLLYGMPFGFAFLVSGMMNLEIHKVLPHVARQSELVVTCWVAVNLLRAGDRIGSSLSPMVYLLLVMPFLQTSWGAYDLWVLNTPGTGNYTNPNQFAAYAVFLLPFLLVRYLTVSPHRRAWLWGMSLWATGFWVWTSFSRSALIGGLTGVGAVLLLELRKERTLTIPARKSLLASAVFLLLWVAGVRLMQFHPAQAGATNADDADSAVGYYLTPRNSRTGMLKTLHNRLVLQRFAAQLWWRSPLFGLGPEAYSEAFQENRERIRFLMFGNVYPASVLSRQSEPFEVAGTLQGASVHAHNLYLQTLTESGLLGLAGFLFYIGAVGHVLWSRQSVSTWATAGLALLATLLLHGLAEVTLPSLSPEIGVLLGLALQSEEGKA